MTARLLVAGILPGASDIIVMLIKPQLMGFFMYLFYFLDVPVDFSFVLLAALVGWGNQVVY